MAKPVKKAKADIEKALDATRMAWFHLDNARSIYNQSPQYWEALGRIEDAMRWIEDLD